ncbi:MAG: hypothetical protein M2R45_03764 [Verrucomicrobia subdivision 3 bacterium]|nr:hypothetical protein [Limisphaerales bacterium]MCS1416912.1 hypothetical protein [Limisphaerales bacterium]
MSAKNGSIRIVNPTENVHPVLELTPLPLETPNIELGT